MKKNEWAYIVGVFLLFSLILAGCTNQVKREDDGTIKIIAAHNQTSPDNPYQTGLLEFKRVTEELSNGEIEVEVHAGTIGTEESELVEKLQLDAVDVVVVSPGFMTQTGIKEVNYFQHLIDRKSTRLNSSHVSISYA